MATSIIIHGSRACNLMRNGFLGCNKFQFLDEKRIIRALSSKTKDPFATPVTPKKKKVFIPQITLLQPNDAKTVMSLEAAEKLAKRRNMKLIKMQDFEAHTERPLYKLLTDSQYRETEINTDTDTPISEGEKVQFKSEKLLTLSRNIGEHDLQVKIKNINKLLSKLHTVKVLVSYDENSGEKTAKILESGIKKNGKVHQRVQKSSTIVYVLHPLLPDAAPKDNSDESKAVAREVH